MNNLIILTIIIWVIAIFLSIYKKQYLFLLLPLCVFVLNELMYIFIGKEITRSQDRTALFL